MPEPGKLGKLAPLFDLRTLDITDYVVLEELDDRVPTTTVWDDDITDWGMMLNGPDPENPDFAPDGLGCCTCSACGHAIQTWTVLNGAEVTVPNAAILTAYEDNGGYVPGHTETDGGCYELVVLKYFRNVGIDGHKIGAFADLRDLRQHELVKASIYLFDALYIGLSVSQSALDQFRGGQDWELVDDDGGIKGGHAAVVLDYDLDGVRLVTWKRIQRMSWDFWDKYVDEAHVLFSEEWLTAGVAPNGVKRDKLLADLARISGEPVPDPEPPAWTPDPTIDADIDWIGAMAAEARTQYDAGEVAVAGETLAKIDGYPGRLGRYLAQVARGETPGRAVRPDGQ